MATLKCLACGHENPAGAASCATCTSALDLQLCQACEAINAHDARHCHGCGVPLRPGPDSAQSPPARRDTLASSWVIETSEPRPRGHFKSAVWLLPVLALTAVAGFHYSSGGPQSAPSAASPARPGAQPAINELKVTPGTTLKAVSQDAPRGGQSAAGGNTTQ
jgi:hypothetical protein